MKLIPTASQTVGPFFSLGLAPHYQDAEATLASASDAIVLHGAVVDGDRAPIPDCVLEFFAANFFARVATRSDGQFRVAIPPGAPMCEVLVFMRGLLLPALTRVHLGESTAKGDLSLAAVPNERIPTLLAHPTNAPNEFEWNIRMQGDDETVFFET
jgi:protocatechuate 3,4-dioxygenase, alpha subunit